jgi:uncharacterized protein (TIGR03663 family)
MKRSTIFLLVTLGVVLLGGALRFPHLNDRPLHCDEAILADKFGTLLETGSWKYDPTDYHGPTLIYLSMITAWVSRIHHYVDLRECTLRVVPALAGMALLLMPLLLRRGLGDFATLASMLLMAASPAMVYYSRYYIPEMLLLAFNFGVIISFYFYFQNPRVVWALSGGVFLGLMAATKETAVLAYGAMFVALLLVGFWHFKTRLMVKIRSINLLHLLLITFAASAVAALLLSSFAKNWQGVSEFVGSFVTYGRRAGEHAWHLHPWYFYFQLLLFFHEGPGPVWSEAVILLLALVGSGAVLFSGPSTWTSSQNDFSEDSRSPRLFWCRYLLVYTALMALIYSVIQYKTPWCLINFWQGVILLGGVGMMWLSGTSFGIRYRRALMLLLGLGIGHLVWLAQLGNSRYCADSRNPYVYAHTGMDVFEMARQIDRLAEVHPEHSQMMIQIFSRQNLWPLPWYLRRYPRQQWWRTVEVEAPLAQVILATPEMEPALVRKIYELPPPGQREMYMWMFKEPLQLRPRVEVRGYVAKSLWDKLE